MKRFLLILILLFPVLTLVIWVYFGMIRSGKLSPAPAPPVVPAMHTNSNFVPAK